MAVSEPMIFLYKCPYYWGKIDRIEAEEILKDQPNGSYLWKDPDQINKKITSIEIVIMKNSKYIYEKILINQFRGEKGIYYFVFSIIEKKVDITILYASESENFNLLEETMACFDKCLSRLVSESLASFNRVLRNRPFSLMEFTRKKICNPGITHEEISKLEFPQVLQDYLQEIWVEKCPDFLAEKFRNEYSLH